MGLVTDDYNNEAIYATDIETKLYLLKFLYVSMNGTSWFKILLI